MMQLKKTTYYNFIILMQQYNNKITIYSLNKI